MLEGGIVQADGPRFAQLVHCRHHMFRPGREAVGRATAR
jgi:hypothetical protein